MIKIKSLLIVISAVAFMSIDMTANAASSPEPEGQTTTINQTNETVKVLKQQLPIQLGEGLVWTDIEINTSGTLITFTFTIDPMKLAGITIEACKTEFNNFSKQQIRDILDSDLIDTLVIMNCDGRIIFKYPDGSQSMVDVPLK